MDFDRGFSSGLTPRLFLPFFRLWPSSQGRKIHPKRDTAFLLTVGSFLLKVELSYLQLTILACLLTLELFLPTVLAFYLQLKLSCLQWESASNKGLKGLSKEAQL